jgi:hypothetical protein
LFLFFNADLVQYKLDMKRDSMAFVDDYTAWVIESSADVNRDGIQAIINRAMNWERRSGTTFKGEKTTLVYFTRDATRINTILFTIKGETVTPKNIVKILGVVIDSEL